MNDIKVVTICGSMKFSKEMMREAAKLQIKEGYAVIQCVYNINEVKCDGYNPENLGKIHRKKIEISDAIYIVNVEGYIGESTKKEIEYARLIGKEILFMEPVV